MAAFCLLSSAFVFFVACPSLSASGGWVATYGGIKDDHANCIQQTSDGGYIMTGWTESFGAGEFDILVLKLQPDGRVQWQKSYGRGYPDEGHCIQQTNDGGYVVAGCSFGVRRDFDLVVLKLKADGTIEWQKTYGGDDTEEAYSIQQTSDGGYIVAGRTRSFGPGAFDFWVLKLRADGAVEWQKAYGGVDWDEAHFIQQTKDGGYIVAGRTGSFGSGEADFWVLKLGPDGTIEWQKTYGGMGWDDTHSIQQTGDGGYVVTGATDSFGAGGLDAWVLKLRPDGTVEWQKTYGGVGWEYANSILQTSGGGYVVAGWTTSFGAGAFDFWVLKLRADGAVEWQKTYGGGDGDMADFIQQTSDGGYIVAGMRGSFGAGGIDILALKLRHDGSIHPLCNFARNTSISGKNSIATVSTTSVSPIDSDGSPQNASVIVLDTDISVNILCP